MNVTKRAPITALLYSDGELAARILERTANAAIRTGLNCAGLIQRDEPRAGRSRCDMFLEELASGDRYELSEDRGSDARGCRLDVSELVRAMEAVRASLENGHDRCDFLVLNKFGKSEAEGGGLRPLIAQALALNIPILLAVPWRNVENWREFVGDFSQEVDCETLAHASEAELMAAVGLINHQNENREGGACSAQTAQEC